jgi:hypothetical protein
MSDAFGTPELKEEWTKMFSEFKAAWTEYKRIWRSVKHRALDAVKGRVEVARVILAVEKKNPLYALGPWVAKGDFRSAGDDFVRKCEELQGSKDARVYVQPCLTALACFVKFLVFDKSTRFTFKGLDDSVRDIYSSRHPEFKTEWTRVLRRMVEWVRMVYPNEGNWNRYLETVNTKEKVKWGEILEKLAAAEMLLRLEVEAGDEKRQAMLAPKRAKSELVGDHALARMRGLLGAI